MFDVILNGARKIWHRVTSSGTCPSSPSSSAPVEAQGMEAEEFFYWHEMLDGFKKNDQRTCLQMMPAGAKEMLSSSELFNDGDVEDFVNWQERYAQRRQGFSEPGPSPSANDHCVDLQDLEDENSDSEASSSSLGLGSEYEEDTASEWSEDNFEFAFDCNVMSEIEPLNKKGNNLLEIFMNMEGYPRSWMHFKTDSFCHQLQLHQLFHISV